MRVLFAIFGMFLAQLAIGASFKTFSVSEHDGIYEVRADMQLSAPPRDVRYVILDFNHLTRITGAVRESRLLDHPATDAWRVFTRTKACIAIFCRTIKQVQDVHIASDGTIVAQAEPAHSDVRSSHTTWKLDPVPGGTRLRWQMRMEPEFWVPPLIGPIMLRHALRAEGEATAQGIEKLALERAQRLHHPLPQ